MRRCIQYAVLVFATMGLTTVLQPLSLFPTFAGPVQQAGCQTFAQTGKIVCGKFLVYWQQNGGLAQQGYPISNEFSEKSDLNGQTYTVQYFERAVFELHPENQPPNDVLLSQLGTFQARQKYGVPPVWPGAPTPTPVPPPGVGTVITVRENVQMVLDPATSGINKSCANETAMYWQFTFTNKSALPFAVNLDKESVRETDSTGKTYKLGKGCGNGPLDGAFRAPSSLGPNSTTYGWVAFNAEDLPSSAAYLELSMTINGQPMTFRYSLR